MTLAGLIIYLFIIIFFFYSVYNGLIKHFKV